MLLFALRSGVVKDDFTSSNLDFFCFFFHRWLLLRILYLYISPRGLGLRMKRRLIDWPHEFFWGGAFCHEEYICVLFNSLPFKLPTPYWPVQLMTSCQETLYPNEP